MKKCFYLFAMTALPVTNLLAQPVVNHMEEYVAGTTIKQLSCDPTNANAGPSGINQVWDMSGLTTAHPSSPTIDSIHHYIMDNPSSGSLFPSATVIDTSNESASTWVYLNQTGSETYFIGYKTGYNGASYGYTNPGLLFAKQPIHYNDQFSTPFTASGTNGNVTAYAHGTYTAFVDGYGTLKLPNGNFDNVLRVKIVKDETDSTGPANTAESVTTEYDWYDNDHSKPLLTISSLLPAGSPSPTVTVKYLLTQTPLLAVNNVVSNASDLKGCFQNDALILNGSFKQGASYQVAMMNLSGQVIYKNQFTASGNSVQLYPQQLPAGMYIVSLMENNRAGISTLKVVKE